jgi:uncharacterized damage-inducible protein DinB
MQLNNYVANRLREVLTEGKWVLGTNLQAELEDVDWKEATRQVANFNTLAALTYHITYYLEGVTHAIQTGELTIKDAYSFDAPVIETANDWQQLRERYTHHAEQLIAQVAQMTEEQITADFADGTYGTTVRNIDALVEHTYYHVGQFMLIKKYLRSS